MAPCIYSYGTILSYLLFRKKKKIVISRSENIHALFLCTEKRKDEEDIPLIPILFSVIHLLSLKNIRRSWESTMAMTFHGGRSPFCLVLQIASLSELQLKAFPSA